jgi:hypothetical protein
VKSPDSGARARVLIGAAAATVSLSYLLMVATAAVGGLTTGAGPAPWGLLVAAVPLWLAAHQIPLVVTGAPLGVLPLLPTVAILVLISAASRRAAERLGGRWREDGPPVVALLAGVHSSLAVLTTALPESPARATAWSALVGGGLVAAVGATVGVHRCAGPPAWWATTPGWLRVGFAATRTAMLALVGAGALLLLARMLAVVNEMHARLDAMSPALGARVGITLLSLGYLPNVLVASVSWIAGPGVSIGAAAASPVFTSLGAVPPIPLMAIMPSSRTPAWTIAVFAVPLVVGVLAGLRCRGADSDPTRRVAAVGLVAGMVATVLGIAALVVSGHLAGGPFDPVVVPAVSLVASLVGWIGLPAAIVVLLPPRTSWRRLTGRRSGAREDVVNGDVEPAPDPPDYPLADSEDWHRAVVGEDVDPDGIRGHEDGQHGAVGHDTVDHDTGENTSSGGRPLDDPEDRSDRDDRYDDYPELELNEHGELERLDAEDR